MLDATFKCGENEPERPPIQSSRSPEIWTSDAPARRGRARVLIEGSIGKCLGLGDANRVDTGYQ